LLRVLVGMVEKYRKLDIFFGHLSARNLGDI
jgi:hypothetical protein